MAELRRVAQLAQVAAVRSTPLLRNSAPTWKYGPFPISSASSISRIRQMSTTPFLRTPDPSDWARDSTLPPRSPLARTQYQEPPKHDWSNPSREAVPSQDNETDIKKPNISSYDDPFAPEIDFDSGELDKSIIEERPASTRPPLRLVPRTGRTIHVGRSVDVARSFKLLAIQIAVNRVRSDSYAQKFHERPGLKRKRLKSERWQSRFKKGFKACVSRVKELTKQGW